MIKASTFVYCPHRSGSMTIYRISKYLCDVKNYRLMSINNAVPDDEESFSTMLYDGHFFCPLRSAMFLPGAGDSTAVLDLRKVNAVVQIRDPRDQIVSYYYSLAYSHSPPPRNPEKFLEMRARFLKMGIDESIVEIANIFREVYNVFMKCCKDHGLNHVKYEKMVTDFPSWSSDFLRYINEDNDEIKSMILQKFGDEMSNIPKTENIYAHRRQSLPGNYRQKLSKSSIAWLNDAFRDEITFFKYPM